MPEQPSVEKLCEILECDPEEVMGQVSGLKSRITQMEELLARRDLKLSDLEMSGNIPTQESITASVTKAVASIGKAAKEAGMINNRLPGSNA